MKILPFNAVVALWTTIFQLETVIMTGRHVKVMEDRSIELIGLQEVDDGFEGIGIVRHADQVGEGVLHETEDGSRFEGTIKGEAVSTGVASPRYLRNYDRIFGKRDN